LKFPEFFPIRTVLPLRVAIAEPKAIDAMYRAAWQRNTNIGDETVLVKVLSEAGFDAKSLIERAQSTVVKEQLTSNTLMASNSGVIGVPSYIVDDELVWGQDRINVVQDLLCGWQVPLSTTAFGVQRTGRKPETANNAKMWGSIADSADTGTSSASSISKL